MHNILINQIVTLLSATAGEEAIKPIAPLSWQSINTQVMHFLQSAWQMLPALSLGIIVIIVCYYLAKPLSYCLVKPLSYVSESRLLHLVTRRFISVVIILFGMYVFLRLAGLSEFAVAVMSGTGLVGLILGFAFRDIAENFISSMLLSVQRPFRIDDVIEVDNRLGVVKKVTARATTLVDFDGNHIQIPNATIYKSVIKNLTANPKIRGHFSIGIGYDNDIRQSQQLAMNLIEQQSAVLSDPPPQVLIEVLGSATINLTIYFWVNSEQHSVIKVASQLMRTLVNHFTEQGISMPDDARERIILSSSENPERPNEALTEKTQPQPTATVTTKSAQIDDVSSDTHEIREQAEKSRDPEQGDNII